jgi:phosphomannomutase
VTQLIVSISGIRGIIGDGLGPREAVRFGMALGTHLARKKVETSAEGPPCVVMGRDSRPSGPMLMAAMRAGLLGTGCRIVDVGILSTPGISLMVRHLGAAGGVIITASHNPTPYNGIKMISPAGTALNRQAGQAVLDLYTREEFVQAAADAMAAVEGRNDAAEVHVSRVVGLVNIDLIRACGFHVAVDAVNGAGGREMTLLLERLGCRVTMIYGDPTGRFGRGAEPIPENLGDLGRAVRKSRTVVGLALDPDADRLALVDETGRAIGEEYTLALAARHRLTQKSGPLAANLSTSRMMDDVAAEAGVTLHRTPVGEVNVAEAILANNCVIGGEGNGGVIDPRVTPVRDSLVGAAMILEMLATRRLRLSELAAELPVYTMVKDKIPLGATPPAEVFAAVRKQFAGARVDERDGLHLSLEDGWVHIRASNTEPILRVMAEAADEAKARGWVAEVKKLAAG